MYLIQNPAGNNDMDGVQVEHVLQQSSTSYSIFIIIRIEGTFEGTKVPTKVRR